MIFDPNELNYSKVHTYLDCPLLFKSIYIDGRRVPLTPLSSLGLSVHKGLAAYHASNGTQLDELLGCYDDCWLGAGYRDAQEQMEHYTRGRRMLQTFWQENSERKTLVVAVERDFDFPHLKWRVKGTIDRIDRHPDGEHEIIDYKSGPELRTETDLAQSLQLGIYGLGTKRALGINPGRITWWFLLHAKRVSVQYNPASEAAVLAQFEAAGEGILARNFEPRHEFCPTCGLNRTCPRSKL